MQGVGLLRCGTLLLVHIVQEVSKQNGKQPASKTKTGTAAAKTGRTTAEVEGVEVAILATDAQYRECKKKFSEKYPRYLELDEVRGLGCGCGCATAAMAAAAVGWRGVG